jgi:hypothetical protein
MIAQEFDSQGDLPKESRTRVIRATEGDSWLRARRGPRYDKSAFCDRTIWNEAGIKRGCSEWCRPDGSCCRGSFLLTLCSPSPFSDFEWKSFSHLRPVGAGLPAGTREKRPVRLENSILNQRLIQSLTNQVRKKRLAGRNDCAGPLFFFFRSYDKQACAAKRLSSALSHSPVTGSDGPLAAGSDRGSSEVALPRLSAIQNSPCLRQVSRCDGTRRSLRSGPVRPRQGIPV